MNYCFVVCFCIFVVLFWQGLVETASLVAQVDLL